MTLKEVLRIMLSEKAKSRAQQRFFGMVRAAQKGEMDNPSSEVLDAADSMTVDDVKKFAKTKHKGLPEKKKIEEVAFLAAAGKAALAAGKGAIKQKAKQVIKQKAANVAAGAIPQPNRDQQMESKGTAELASLALRGKKRCVECGSFSHVTGDCPKKEHSVKESNKYKGVLTDPMKEAYRVLASSDGQEKPSQFSYKDEKTAKKYANSIKKGGGKATVTKESVLTRLGRKKKVEEKKPKKAMDAGARAKRLLQRRIHAKYVSGSQDLVPDDIRDHYEVVDEKVATGPRLGELRQKGATHVNAGEGEKVQARTLAWMRKKGMKGSPGLNAMKEREAEHKAKRGVKKEEVELDERLGGKGYKPYTSLTGKKVSGDWEDSDRGAGNKATRRAGGKVEKKSPTYLAHVHNKEKKVNEASAVLDANTKIKNTEDRKKKEKEYARLMGILAHQKDLKKRGLSSSYESEGEMVEARVDKGRSDYGKATIRNWRHSGPSTVEPAMFDPENKRGKTIDKRREEHKARRGVKGAKVPTYTKEEKIEEGNWIQKKWNELLPPPSQSASPCVRSGNCKPGKLETPGLNLMNNTARTINQPIKTLSKAAKTVKSTVDKAVPVVKAAAGPVAAGLAVSKSVDSLMKGGKKKTNEELSIVDRMLIEYSPNVAYQDKKKGKLGKSSVYSLRGKDESKKDFRKSHVKDIEGGYVGGGHKPTPGNLKKEGVVLEKKKQPSVHDDYYDPMEDPTFDPHEAEATRGQSGRGTKGKMNVRKKYPVK